MYTLKVVSVLMLTWIIWTILSLYRNYRIAKTIKVPIVISPISIYNPLLILAYKLCPPIITILKSVPLGRWPRVIYIGWHFDDKYQVHKELGPVFVLCHPSGNELTVADPNAARHIFSKRKDFVKPGFIYEALNIFGRNLDSVEGETWQRHRKITAPSFNERVSALVWVESNRQAAQMLEQWTDKSNKEGTRNVAEDTAYLALNVLTHAGFGNQYPFRNANDKNGLSGAQNSRDSLSLVLRNFTYLIAVPAKMLKLPIFPRSLQAVSKACYEFELYMKDTVRLEKEAIKNSKQDSILASNLLSTLIRASEAEAQGLTDEEIYGNIFIYNLAGHETTANALATAIAYLAAYPQWQEWLHEEIKAVSNTEHENWKYEIVWPKLKRCQAVMLETLRLHGSIVSIPKSASGFQPLTIKGSEHLVPPDTFVTINVQALHCDPSAWGEDVLKWRPDRWMVNSTSENAAEEDLIEPEPGTFVPWADGPRVCPGKKFSQVEFTGVISTLFRSHRVRPQPATGETEAIARQRVERMIEDSTIKAITLQMTRPRDVAFVWEAR